MLRSCLKTSRPRRETEETRSLRRVNEEFSTTSNAEIGVFRQLLSRWIFLLLFYGCPKTLLAENSCQPWSRPLWESHRQKFLNREMIAFASWCSSCKEKLVDVKSSPDLFVLFSVYDSPSSSERVLNRFQLKSPCFFLDQSGIEYFQIKGLPWSRKVSQEY